MQFWFKKSDNHNKKVSLKKKYCIGLTENSRVFRGLYSSVMEYLLSVYVLLIILIFIL